MIGKYRDNTYIFVVFDFTHDLNTRFYTLGCEVEGIYFCVAMLINVNKIAIL